jgi:uncharacterized membrane protein
MGHHSAIAVRIARQAILSLVLLCLSWSMIRKMNIGEHRNYENTGQKSW